MKDEKMSEKVMQRSGASQKFVRSFKCNNDYASKPAFIPHQFGSVSLGISLCPIPQLQKKGSFNESKTQNKDNATNRKVLGFNQVVKQTSHAPSPLLNGLPILGANSTLFLLANKSLFRNGVTASSSVKMLLFNCLGGQVFCISGVFADSGLTFSLSSSGTSPIPTEAGVFEAR